MVPGWKGGVVVDGADQLDRGVLESVVINEEPFVEVYLETHVLLLVILVQKANIPGQVAFVVDSVETLAGA